MKNINRFIDKIGIATVLILTMLPALGFGQDGTSELSQEKEVWANDIIEKAELFRGFDDRDFKYAMEVTDILGEETRSITKLDVFVNIKKEADSNGDRDTLVKMTTGRDSGNVILQKGVDMWFYKAGTAQAFRISSSQRLMGNASYADVSSTNYSSHYKPVAFEETKIGKTPVYKMTLNKTERGVAYSRVEFFITQDNENRPVKAEFYTPSGKMLKTMYFRKYASINGKMISTEWVLVDSLNKKAITYIRIQSLSTPKLSESMFTMDGIKKL